MIPLEDLIIYNDAMALGEEVWKIVGQWGHFERQTVGRQFIRSADSVAANISEGHGRYHYGERRQFCYYARGSLHETKTWVRKSVNRGLIAEQKVKELEQQITTLAKMLNGYLRTIQPRPAGLER